MTDSAAVDARFWNRQAARYSKRPVPDEQAYRQTLDHTRSYLKKSDRVLEVGCGTGSTALQLCSGVHEIVATDVSCEMIAIAREKARSQGVVNVSFDVATVGSPQFGPAEFDVVMAFNLLHLVPDLAADFKQLKSLIKPGGYLVSKTPCVGEDGWLIRTIIPVLQALGKAPSVNYLKKKGLELAFEEAGFEVLERADYPRNSRSFFIVARN